MSKGKNTTVYHRTTPYNAAWNYIEELRADLAATRRYNLELQEQLDAAKDWANELQDQLAMAQALLPGEPHQGEMVQ